MKRKLAAILAFIMVLCTCINAMAGSYSLKWTQKSDGNWQVYKNGVLLKNTWVLDDECDTAGGVWYLIDENGNMVVAPLVHDGEGHYYSFNDQHNGCYGAMLTANGSYYGVKLNFEQNHNGGYGSISNADGIAALTEKYGVKEMPNIKNATTVKLSEVNKVAANYVEESAVYFRLNFDLNGVTVTTPSNYKEQKVAFGYLAKAPAATPSDVTETYSFAGWFNGDTEWNFATDKVTRDTTLTAAWKLNNFIVTFDANGGSFPDGSTSQQVKCEPGSLISEPGDKPAMTGKVFDGWYKDKEGTTRWDFSDDTVTSDTTIYAKWIGLFTVTFDANGGSFEEEKTTYTKQCSSGSLVSAPGTNPTKTGKAFGGWYKDKEGTNPWDFYSDTVTSDVTLYAKWADLSYELDRFNFNYYFHYTYTNECNLVLGSHEELKSYLGEQIDRNISKDGSVKMYKGTGSYAGSILVVADGDNAVVFPEDSHELFNCFEHVKNIVLKKVDTSKVTNMHGMFKQCTALKSIVNLSSFNTENVTNMEAMFLSCDMETLDLTSFDTENVTDMHNMFANCDKLVTIYASDKFVTTGLTEESSGSNMFYDCTALKGVSNGSTRTTAYDGAKTGKEYACICTTDTPGYFSPKAPH